MYFGDCIYKHRIMSLNEFGFGIFKNKDKKESKTEENKNSDIKFTLTKVTSKDKFDYLYNKEAMCAEGLKNPDKEETAKTFANHIRNNWNCKGGSIEFYYCFGRDLNKIYHLTGDNKYDDNLGIFFIDWSKLPSNFDISSHKGSFRWFSDVVDNNARREIRKKNPYYKDYHSLYGDDWFYSTI